MRGYDGNICTGSAASLREKPSLTPTADTTPPVVHIRITYSSDSSGTYPPEVVQLTTAVGPHKHKAFFHPPQLEKARASPWLQLSPLRLVLGMCSLRSEVHECGGIPLGVCPFFTNQPLSDPLSPFRKHTHLRSVWPICGAARWKLAVALQGGHGGNGANPSMTAGVSSIHLESELENVVRELELVDVRLSELQDAKSALLRRRDRLSVEIQARKKRRELCFIPGERK